MSDTSPVDFSDIQGLVRFSYAHLSEAAYLLANISNSKKARAWLRTAPITSAIKQDPRPNSALQVAISINGLRALEISSSIIDDFSDEFIDGMADGRNRSRRLGDIGANNPSRWDWGKLETGAPDLLIMLFASPGQLQTQLNNLQDPEFNKAFSVSKTLTSDRCDGREPFGFKDGISQPQINWQQTVSTDLHERDRYSNRVALGEVVLGYPNEYGLYTERPLVDAKSAPNLPVALEQHNRSKKLHDLGRHGTYLVMRQLDQDVAGFWQFIKRHASDGNHPNDEGQRESLAAAMVGRHINGEPLIEKNKRAIDGIKQDSDNNFDYDQDPFGNQCPIGAHVRRANPRTGDFPSGDVKSGVSGLLSRLVKTLGFKRKYPTDDLISSTRFHRILRRGRPYGPCISPEQALKENSPTTDTGLHFICLGANISRQFEFVQNAWLMSSKFAGLSAEQDPLIGVREPLAGIAEKPLAGIAKKPLADTMPTNTFSQPQEKRPTKCIANLPQFVHTRGGAYFFLPGLAALQYLASEPSTDST